MEVTISNKITLKNPPEDLKQYLIEELKLKNPKYDEAVRRGRSTWGLDPFIFNFDMLPDGSLRIPRGYRSKLLNKLTGLKAVIKDDRTLFPYADINSASIKYWPFQERAMKTVVRSDEGLVVAPAGSGKTVLGISMIPLFGQPALWLTHTNTLAKQTLDRIKEFLPSMGDGDVGFIGNGKWEMGKWITVALIPTLVRRPEELFEMRNDFGLVIIDEGHHTPSSTFLKVVNNLNPFYLYGLTATPYRRDKLEKLMFDAIGPEIVSISIAEVEEHGGIVMPIVRYKTLHSKPVYGNKIQDILKENVVNNKRRNNIIVGDVLREAVAGNYCIVLTDRRVHADMLYDLISIGWAKTGVATGKYSRKYVEEQASRLNKKEITVLVCTFSLLGEGFDVKFLNRAFLTMPFRAQGRVEQLVGRIQRSAEGKADAILYDYLDVDIGVLKDQFYTRGKNDCRYKAYKKLGLEIEPY